MKKIFTIIGLMLLALTTLKAQEAISDPDKMWTVPAIYTMDEPVTWYFDLASAAQVADGEALYMWIWAPSNPTGEPIPIEYDGDRIWKISFIPTEFFGMSAEAIFANTEPFYFLLRDLDATKLTGTLSLPKVDYIKNFVESGKEIDFGPSDFQLGSTLSILFNSNLVDGFNPVPSTVHMHGGLNDWDAPQTFDAWLPEIREKTQFKDMGNGIYKKDLVPETYFGVTEEYEMENVVFLVAKYNGDDGNPDWAGASPDYRIIAPGVPIPPPPSLYFFPLKISINDILIITRENNNRGQRLSYTITGGDKTLSGEMEGAMIRQRAFINIAKEFEGMDIPAIAIVIKDQNESVIYNGNIPLVKVDNLK